VMGAGFAVAGASWLRRRPRPVHDDGAPDPVEDADVGAPAAAEEVVIYEGSWVLSPLFMVTWPFDKPTVMWKGKAMKVKRPQRWTEVGRYSEEVCRIWARPA